MVDKKGFDIAVDAARELTESGIDFHWRFVGGGPLLPSLMARAADLIQAGVVEFSGPVDHETALSAIGESSMLVLPCKSGPAGDIDGIPVALMEAMTRSVPVVSTRFSGIPELVIDGVTGLLCDPGDASSLAAAVLKLNGESSIEKELRIQRAKDHVDRQFNAGIEAEKLVGHFLGT